MKKLTILLSILLISIIGLSQTDTTIFFESKTVTEYRALILYESEFKTVDYINFDETQDSLLWVNSRWIRKDSIYVNQNRYKIRQIQFRMNQQGIKQRRHRAIVYSKRTITKRSIRN